MRSLVIIDVLDAEHAEDAEGWVDALLMSAHIAGGQRLPALAYALTADFS